MIKLAKSLLQRASPRAYVALRDQWQFHRLKRSGELDQIVKASDQIETDEQALAFAKSFIHSYQIDVEILGLIRLIREKQPRSFMEIGTADGGTHFLVRRCCPSIECSVAIDTDIRGKMLLDRITTTKESHYFTGKSGDDRTIQAVRQVFPEQGSLDVLFIDGDHSYDGVSSDFEIYQHLVRSGGLIIVHDIVEDWNQRYGKPTNKFTGGVPQFFAEQKQNFEHLTFVEDPGQDGFGIGVLVQP